MNTIHPSSLFICPSVCSFCTVTVAVVRCLLADSQGTNWHHHRRHQQWVVHHIWRLNRAEWWIAIIAWEFAFLML